MWTHFYPSVNNIVLIQSENAKPDGIIIYFTGNRPSFIPDCVKWKNKEETDNGLTTDLCLAFLERNENIYKF